MDKKQLVEQVKINQLSKFKVGLKRTLDEKAVEQLDALHLELSMSLGSTLGEGTSDCGCGHKMHEEDDSDEEADEKKKEQADIVPNDIVTEEQSALHEDVLDSIREIADSGVANMVIFLNTERQLVEPEQAKKLAQRFDDTKDPAQRMQLIQLLSRSKHSFQQVLANTYHRVGERV